MADIETVAVAADGTPIARMEIIDKETGTKTPVNVATCAEGVTCNSGKNLQEHLEELHAHANDAGAHLTAGEKAVLETQAGAQEKATTAKNEAVTAASLMVEQAKADAAEDANAKASAARISARNYTDELGALFASHEVNTNNPHFVTATQVGALPAIESTDFPGCYYRLVNGKKEWYNPPMELGVEYRTVERDGGNPVYVKKIDLGALPNNSHKAVQHGLSKVAFLAVETIAKSTTSSIVQPFPFFSNSGTLQAKVHLTNDAVNVYSFGDVSNYTAETTLRYTK